MESKQDTNSTANPPSTPAAGSAFFVIQRPAYPDWYAGANEHGPMWTSSFHGAFEVPADMLVKIMRGLAPHRPCAILLPNARTERCGRPNAFESARQVARPHSLQ